jgi:hypothetical protein
MFRMRILSRICICLRKGNDCPLTFCQFGHNLKSLLSGSLWRKLTRMMRVGGSCFRFLFWHKIRHVRRCSCSLSRKEFNDIRVWWGVRVIIIYVSFPCLSVILFLCGIIIISNRLISIWKKKIYSCPESSPARLLVKVSSLLKSWSTNDMFPEQGIIM